MFVYLKGVRLFLVLCLLIVTFTLPGTLPTGQEDPVNSITTAELRDHTFFLASDELEGRETGSKGYDIAAMYALTQLRMAGLKPMLAGAEGQPGFYQHVPIISYYVGKRSALTIGSSAGEIRIFHLDKMVLFLNTSARPDILKDQSLVFLGYGIDDHDIGWSDYAGVDVKGKVVIVMTGAPKKNGRPIFPSEKDKFYRSFGNVVNAKVGWATEQGVSAVILVPEPEIAADWKGNILERTIRRQYNFHTETSLSGRSPEIFFMHPDPIFDILKLAGYAWTYDAHDYQPAVLKDIKVNGSVEKDRAQEVIGKNIVAVLPGTDPVLKNEYVVLHAHLDHLGLSGDGAVRNGADDNASGCAILLEVAEALTMKPTKRSFIFAFFTAEERGLLGSEWFINHTPVPLEKIVFNATADMIGRQSEGKPDVVFITAGGADSEDVYDIVRRANESGIRSNIEFLKEESELHSCDIQHFLTRHIPSLLFSRGAFPPHYHSPSDDAETLDYIKITKAGQLLYRTLLDLGNR